MVEEGRRRKGRRRSEGREGEEEGGGGGREGGGGRREGGRVVSLSGKGAFPIIPNPTRPTISSSQFRPKQVVTLQVKVAHSPGHLLRQEIFLLLRVHSLATPQQPTPVYSEGKSKLRSLRSLRSLSRLTRLPSTADHVKGQPFYKLKWAGPFNTLYCA